MSKQPKISIGIISYKDKRYLEYNLPSLTNQSYKNFEILVCDNNPDKDLSKWIHQVYPSIKILGENKNLGFSRGHNLLINNSTGDYYLCFNSDMVANTDFLQNLINIFTKINKLGCVTGKILQWSNYPDSPLKIKENYIDTTGLQIQKDHHVTDIGQGEKDSNKYNQIKEIWGASGASAMYKIEALRDISHNKTEFFDEDFFMYKEDIDLSYRLRWAGWKTYFTPYAIAWHDRTASKTIGIINNIKKRKQFSKLVKKHSFINQQLLIDKNFSKHYDFIIKIKTYFFILKYFIYLLVFDTKILKYYKKYLKLKKIIKTKKITKRIAPSEMQIWFK